MPNWLDRFLGRGGAVPGEGKAAPVQSLFAVTPVAGIAGARKGFVALATEGHARNPVVYRCVQMVSEAAARVPWEVREKGRQLGEHPLLDLLARPNGRQTGTALLEALYGYLLTAGNAYLDAVLEDGRVTGLYGLRPDRMQVVAGADGWPVAYAYGAGGASQTLRLDTKPVPRVLHLKLFQPLDDHYGLAPLAAAQTSLETHNAASQWNRALLDNAARPTGALVYNAGGGNLSEDQYRRLKAELEEGFAGALNAGRPMVLEGGLDWRSMALTPQEMDFLEAKNTAAREIALAFGVPPMLLGLPGDNTYANYAEASRALWRQTVIPLVMRVSGAIGQWLGPAFGDVDIVPDFDGVEALADERASLWERVGRADFLTEAEKREALGYAARPEG